MERQENSPQVDSVLIPRDKENKSEIIARFLSLNPAILSQFFGIGTHAFLNQFLRLWPSFRIQALPYISIPTVALAAMGAAIGVDAMKNPNHEIGNNHLKRFLMASMEGVGGIFPFFLGDLIEIYCRNSEHLDAENRCMVSEEIFWKNFFTAPFILSLCYIAWHTISPTQKYDWISAGKKQKISVIGIDLLAKILFYSRIFQMLMLNINPKPEPLLYEGVTAPVTGLVLGMGIFKPQHAQKLDTLLRLLMNAKICILSTVIER